jgi:hypothetical protein
MTGKKGGGSVPIKTVTAYKEMKIFACQIISCPYNKIITDSLGPPVREN